MVSPGYLLRTLQTFGLVNLHRFKSQRRARFQIAYTFFNTHLIHVYVVCQAFNVFTRAIHSFPEFVQKLLDNTLMGILVFIVWHLQSYYQELGAMSDYVDNGFSKADTQVIQRCHHRTNMISLALLIVICFGFTADFWEMVLPVYSDSDRNISVNIYGQSYLKQHLPYIIRVPFINENISPAYEILLAFESYICVLGIILGSVSINIVPVITLHIQTQYEILCKYIRMIGQEHRDEFGYKIIYTDIEKNKYIIKLYSPVIRGTKLMRMKNALEQVRKQKLYEQNYLRQIVNFHQKILNFQYQVTKLFSRCVLVLVMANNVIYVLCLYILVGSNIKLSPQRYFKFVVEFVAFLMEFFLICNSSELMDDCNGMIRDSINANSWINCSNQSRRDLRMILRRVQIPNHLRFHDGAVILSRLFFLKVLKIVYTFVNFMRVKSS